MFEIYIYIYICVCVCVYIYIYIYQCCKKIKSHRKIQVFVCIIYVCGDITLFIKLHTFMFFIQILEIIQILGETIIFN